MFNRRQIVQGILRRPSSPAVPRVTEYNPLILPMACRNALGCPNGASSLICGIDLEATE
jgi:hypothetical protein